MISANIDTIKGRIGAAAAKGGRSPTGVTFLCVTKNRSLEEIELALQHGIRDIGENRVQDAVLKYTYGAAHPLFAGVKWHLIGHLQSNKAKEAVRIFDLIHSVDSDRVAAVLDKEAAKIGKVQDVLVDVNVSGESTKFGVTPDALQKLAYWISELKNLRLRGLMTMAPVVADREQARPYFKELRQLQENLNLFLTSSGRRSAPVLSMGMSQDFETAVEEGATLVRVGTALFES